MASPSKKLTDAKSLPCQGCGGTGTYEKVTSLTYTEPLDHFQQRHQTYLQTVP